MLNGGLRPVDPWTGGRGPVEGRSRPTLSFWTIFGQKIELKRELKKQIDAKTQLSSSNLRQNALPVRDSELTDGNLSLDFNSKSHC